MRLFLIKLLPEQYCLPLYKLVLYGQMDVKIHNINYFSLKNKKSKDAKGKCFNNK